MVKDLLTGKTAAEVAPGKLMRLGLPSHGWLLNHVCLSHLFAKEDGASSSC